MVRLKVFNVDDGIPFKLEFQFQYGAIKSAYIRFTHIRINRFNSNMVRLKEIHVNKTEKGKESFNSNMVRLKANLPYINAPVESCFNSNMVRLKE